MTTQQLGFDFGRIARDEGIKRAEDHANAVVEKWSEKVYAAFVEYLSLTPGKFQTEDFREWLGDRIHDPPHARAFGAITMKAARAGIIKQVGFAHVKNPKAHRANSAVWIAVK